MSERSDLLKFELHVANLCNLIYFCVHGFDKPIDPIWLIFDMYITLCNYACLKLSILIIYY